MICAHCGSHIQIEEYDPRIHTIIGYHCGMCGRNKFEAGEQADDKTDGLQADKPSGFQAAAPGRAKEEPMNPRRADNDGHYYCCVDGCKSLIVKEKMCVKHYREKYGVSPKKHCSAPGCKRVVWRNSMCYHHAHIEARNAATADHPDPNIRMASAPPPASTGAPSPGHCAEPMAPSCHSEERSVVAISPRAELAQIVYDIKDGNGRKAVIAFSIIDGKKVYAEVRIMGPGTFDCMAGTYDDWMFLSAIGNEIKRISEAG
jgi:hypothetical protein